MGDQIPCNTYKKVILFRFSFFYVYYKNIINFPSTKSFNYFDLRLLTCLLTRSLHVPSIVFCFLFLTFKFIRLTISEINEVANRFLRSDIQYIFFSMNSNIVWRCSASTNQHFAFTNDLIYWNLLILKTIQVLFVRWKKIIVASIIKTQENGKTLLSRYMERLPNPIMISKDPEVISFCQCLKQFAQWFPLVSQQTDGLNKSV